MFFSLLSPFSGSAVPISDPNIATPTIGPITQPGEYTFQLETTAPDGTKDTDEVVITVQQGL